MKCFGDVLFCFVRHNHLIDQCPQLWKLACAIKGCEFGFSFF